MSFPAALLACRRTSRCLDPGRRISRCHHPAGGSSIGLGGDGRLPRCHPGDHRLRVSVSIAFQLANLASSLADMPLLIRILSLQVK